MSKNFFPPNVPIIGQVVDYAFGVILILPDTVEARAQLTDSVAKANARIAKGDVAIFRGKDFRSFTLEEFENLMFPPAADKVDEAEEKRILLP